MIGVTQYLITFHLFSHFYEHTLIQFWPFALICLACLLIAGAGNVINDFYDQKADAINCVSRQKIGKSISNKSALVFYISLNLIAVIVLFWGLLYLNQLSKIWVFIFCGFLLFLYSKFLKGVLLIGNLVISFLILISLWLFPYVIFGQKIIHQDLIFGFLISFSLVAFLLNLVREINKDMEDIKGDYASGYKTLPIVLGRKFTQGMIYLVLFFGFASILFYYYFWIDRTWWSTLYFSLLIFIPLLLVIFEYQKNKIKYNKISLLLKISMLFGLGSLLLI